MLDCDIFVNSFKLIPLLFFALTFTAGPLRQLNLGYTAKKDSANC